MKFRCIVCKTKKYLVLCIKTKSSLFLLAYVLFLACCLLMYPLWDPHTAQSIIAGIAIAGACFSFADLFYCIQEVKNSSITKKQELFLMTIKVIKDGEDRLRYLRSSTNNQPGNTIKQETYNSEKGKDIIHRLEKAIDEMESKINQPSIAGNTFMVLGVLLFFVTVSFDSLFLISTDICNYCTIIAFLLVVINFYIKQVYSANIQYNLDETKKNCLKGERFYED